MYLLEIEKSKALEEDRRVRPERYLGDDAQADSWLEIGATLSDRGFCHYEISNWARPGRQARHNRKYWTRTETLGLGVSAHELWAGRRRANVSPCRPTSPAWNPAAVPWPWTKSSRQPTKRASGSSSACVSPRASRVRALDAAVAASADPHLPGDYADWLEAGVLVEEGDRVHFTEKGFLVSNEVLCRLRLG